MHILFSQYFFFPLTFFAANSHCIYVKILLSFSKYQIMAFVIIRYIFWNFKIILMQSSTNVYFWQNMKTEGKEKIEIWYLRNILTDRQKLMTRIQINEGFGEHLLVLNNIVEVHRVHLLCFGEGRGNQWSTTNQGPVCSSVLDIKVVDWKYQRVGRGQEITVTSHRWVQIVHLSWIWWPYVCSHVIRAIDLVTGKSC